MAGSIDDLIAQMLNANDRKFGEQSSRSLIVSLLARIKEYSAKATGAGDECRLRATLAVPLPHPPVPGRKPVSLKVWCYDQPHDDRAFTELPLTGVTLPGSPLAFLSGQIQIIDDVHAEARIPEARSRRYRSIVSIPVKAGGPKGKVLAVLNIDATEPNLFKGDVVERAIQPLVAPSVNLIALVLLMRNEESRYAFNS